MVPVINLRGEKIIKNIRKKNPIKKFLLPQLITTFLFLWRLDFTEGYKIGSH